MIWLAVVCAFVSGYCTHWARCLFGIIGINREAMRLLRDADPAKDIE